MPVKDGKVHFTTTLMALIREALGIKNHHPNKLDIEDIELRWCIAKLWPDISKNQIELLVPTESGEKMINMIYL